MRQGPRQTPTVGALFERKEHLGIAALMLAWIGLLALTLARRRDAAFVAVIAAGAGLIVGAHRSF